MSMTPEAGTAVQPSAFWVRWLTVVSCGVALFGLVMVLSPDLTARAFGLLLYADSQHIVAFDAAVTTYISLLHGVLGAVMLGWGMALLLLVRGPFRRGSRDGWNIIAVSALAWFVPDTVLSLWMGFWQNAVLNVAIVLLLGIPLAVSMRGFRVTSPPRPTTGEAQKR